MSRVVVTGAAGFIGSTLADALRARGDDVVGIDLAWDVDLRTADLAPLLDGADVVFHLAARPGVRRSWSTTFADYAEHNVLATQRLLEATVAAGVPRVVYASSSSVYGQAPSYPTAEDDLPRPHSPYGVTKLAAEHLCNAYAANWGLSTVALRYFTVYGPRQRPDMAIRRLLDAGLRGEPFPLFGDGSAVRDFTFVDDVVAATIAAADADVTPGTVVNVAGGSEMSMRELVALAGDVLGTTIAVEHRPAQPGDVDRTGGRTDRAAKLLGWAPMTGLRAGLAAQAAWQRETSGVQ